jgi:Restriction endonuclease
MANKGTVLQTLVHAVETAVSGSPNVKVESPKRLRDKDTGRWREHDVVLTFTQAHHEFLLALECRNRSRPVGVPDVEGFHAKCLRTGIGRGLMVSSTGFTNTALRKAESYGIGCLRLQEVTRFNWCATPAVTVLNHDLLGANVEINFEREPPLGWVAYSEDGLPITPAVVGDGPSGSSTRF